MSKGNNNNNNQKRGQRYKFCTTTMKLNEVLSEIRKGNLVFNLKVITPKGYDKNVEEISIATTIYYKKHSKVREDDEIVVINGKEFNVSEFARNVNEFKGSEICARLGNRSIVIECEEPEKDIEFNEIYIEGEGDNIRLYIKIPNREKIYLDANLKDYELSECHLMLFDKLSEDYPGKFQNCAYVVNNSGGLIKLEVEEENTAEEDGWGFYAGEDGSIVSEDDSPEKAGFYCTVDSWAELVKQYGDEDIFNLK